KIMLILSCIAGATYYLIPLLWCLPMTIVAWKKLDAEYGASEDRRTYADHSDPANKLSPEERQKVIDTVNEPRFASMPPCQIVPALADEGEYIASESTIYRILREEKMQNHRGRSQEPGKHGKPTSYSATAPCSLE
ncbi:MAG: helix-turn-helix domain-containing protein, partial [Lachnospiraceae bacterium]|nr:helix-turn-helix domain-containing protein [Lachnospiraceae bacterium]